MIHLADVHLTLTSPAGPVHILRGVNLNVSPGATVSVVGPSGSGKSSLLAVIGGIERASSGKVVVDGQDITNLDEDGLALFRRMRVGILFQSFHLIPSMTALENVAIPLEMAGEANAFARAREGLDAVGLDARREHYPSQLSGGEQQRVALARALVIRPKLLLADEPTGNLDQETGAEVIERLFTLQAEHDTTLLLITHDPSLAALAEQRLAMKDGRLDVLAGTMTELVEA
ncbi:ABC transporter ATP-binding protein [Marinivivus vitaminiproducens]|uniref:ABC transporter ATP-binding protein n=1 Tax=Marinivivus vitaminiproducens TaxID=3035935 RepID=UPI0027A9EEEE|nr:ABC transporter ATP-binding protein [Geminicoccaceae bacterium SCSIO 64248]